MGNTGISGKRVLLADDDESVRETLTLLLASEEYEVTSVPDGQEALERLAQMAFDLVITDYSMPGMTGAELAVCIRRSNPAQRILMITAYPHTFPGPDNPVDALLTKPFSITDLRHTVASLVA